MISIRLIFSLFISLCMVSVSADTLLVDVKILDVNNGRITTDKVIGVSGNTISYIGSRESAPEQDWKIVDLQGATVLPGLTDSHVHLTSDATVHGYKRLKVTIPGATITGVVNAEKTLLAGFTTVRNLGAPDYSDLALRDAINAGQVQGPRILGAGFSLGITGGHCDSNLLPYQYQQKSGGVADGPWEVRKKVRQNNKYGVDVIKFCGTGGVLSKGTKIGAQQYSLEEMQAIVDEARLLGLKVAVHAHGADGIETALKAGVDSVEHASFITDIGINLAKKTGAYLSMDVYVTEYILSEGEKAGILQESLDKERKVGRQQRERFKAAVQKGAKIAYGTDAGVYPHGDNAKQLKVMSEWGMTPLEAMQAATIVNANLFGMADKIGSLEVGKFADIIAVDGNPLNDIQLLEKVGFVMKDGEVVKNSY